MRTTATEPRRIAHGDLAPFVAEVTEAGGCIRFRAGGASMWPFVRSGDGLVVRPIGARPVSLGEVLLYRTELGGLVAHRVTGRRGGFLRLRGDRRQASPERVRREQVLGRVVAIEREGRLLPQSGLRRLPALLWLALRPLVRHVRW